MALLLALVSAFVIGIGLVMAVYVGITKLPEYLAQRKLQGRLEELSSPIEEAATSNKALIKISSSGPLPGLERMISGTERGNAFSRWIEQSGMKVSISGVLLVAVFFCRRVRVSPDDAHPIELRHSGGRGHRLCASVHVPQVQAYQASARVRGNVSRGARPDLPRAQGWSRLRNRPEDGGG